MSWDVMILNGDGAPALDCVPDDWMPAPMGDIHAVRHSISEALLNVDWEDSAWGTYTGDGFSIEISVGEAEIVDAFSLHIRGGGDPMKDIARLCKPNNWVAFDFSAGQMLDLDKPTERWGAFQKYRDQVLSSDR